MAYSSTQLQRAHGYLADAHALHQRQWSRWREAHSMVDGTWMQGFTMGGDPDATPVNYAWAYAHTVRSAIYARSPYIFCEATHQAYRPFAKSMETCLNYLALELNLKRHMKQAVMDAEITGQGWLEPGYTATFDTMQIESQDNEGLIRQLMGDAKHPEQQGVLNEYVKEISAYLLRLSPWRVLLAPGYSDLSAMPHLFVQEDIAPEDFDRHPLYKKIGSRNVAATRRSRQDYQAVATASGSSALIPMPTRPINRQSAKDGEAMIRAYHFWDRRNRERAILFEGSNASLGPYHWPSCLEGFQHVNLVFNWLPETDQQTYAYPIGDITPMIPQLKELSLSRTAMVRHRRRAGTLIILPETLATSENMAALAKGDDVSIVTIKGDPKQIEKHSPPALPPDLYRIDDRILADLDLIGRFSQVFLGAPPSKGERTATEVRAGSQGTQFATSEKIDIVEDTVVQVARRWAASLWEHYPREKIRRILGEPLLSESMWPSLPSDPTERCEIICQELQVRIRAGSTQPLKDRAMRNEQRMRFAHIAGQLAPERLKRGVLLEQVAEDMEFEDAQAFIISNDEEEQQHAQEENRLLEQNLPQIVGPNELDEVHIQVHSQGPKTVAKDQHILAHGQRLRSKVPGMKGGGGQSENPEASREMRQGMPEAEDLAAGLSRAMAEPGTEQGGTPTLER